MQFWGDVHFDIAHAQLDSPYGKRYHVAVRTSVQTAHLFCNPDMLSGAGRHTTSYASGHGYDSLHGGLDTPSQELAEQNFVICAPEAND